MLRVDDQAFRTDTGRQRSENEDSLFVRSPIFVVADGMGGAQAGEVASKAAAEAFDRDLPEAPPEQVLRETIEAANREIHELARADPSRAGMGTTITAAIVDARERRGRDRPRRRQPRLPAARRQARAADPRPLAGRGDAPQGPDHRRPGRGPPAALDHHPRARARARRRGRRADRARRPRRRLPALLRRADDDGRRGADRRRALRRRPRCARRCGAGRRGQPGRRARQHHRARLPARGRGGAAAASGPSDADPGRRRRRGGRG